jgi:tripartite-type tricarboxylate transporter receptor subunit TctC
MIEASFNIRKPVMRTIGLCLLATLTLAPTAAPAQEYPSRTVRIIVPFSPGGGTDLIARLIAQKLTQSLGSTFIVENRPGAGGTVGTAIVAKSPPDGHTLLVVSSSHGINPSVYRSLPYDTMRDLAPVSLLMSGPALLVTHPSVPAKSVKALVALARAQPGALTFGSAGVGTPPHLGGELFKILAKVDMTHVPYKGNAAAFIDLVAGEISLMFPNIVSGLPHVKQGRLRAMAVSSRQRSAIAPEIPTVAESGLPGYEMGSWYGFVAPGGTPVPIIARLQQETAKALQLPDVKEKLTTQGVEAIGSTPDEFRKFLQAEIAQWGKVIRAAKLKFD